MPLVFVHGVNTREGDTDSEKTEFANRVEVRDNLFRTTAMAGLVPPPKVLRIENPYWGGYAARFSHDLASLPGTATETFGTEAEGTMAEVLTETLSSDAATNLNKNEIETGLLLALARRLPQEPTPALELAVDTLVAAAACRPATEGGATSERQELARFAAAAMAYLKSGAKFPRLFARDPMTGQLQLKEDAQFIEALLLEVEPFMGVDSEHETFGGGRLADWLKGVASALGATAKRIVGTIAATGMGAAAGAIAAGAPGAGAALGALRPVATQRVGIFLGDVFTYLNNRGTKETPGDIVRIVRSALRAAHEARRADDSKLVVVAHSMGGNIVYDILTHFDPELQIDAFITVGSQVALFKELGLYMEDGRRRSAGPNRIAKPQNISSWVNIFDQLDLLGFAAGGVFQNVTDYAFSTQASPLDAHSTYFLRPGFHQRLRARLAEIGLDTAA